jgi:hypothetical protein
MGCVKMLQQGVLYVRTPCLKERDRDVTLTNRQLRLMEYASKLEPEQFEALLEFLHTL